MTVADGYADGEGRLEVKMLAVKVEFDDTGDIVRARSPARWTGVFCDFRERGGMRMPTRAEASWEVDGARFVYWSGQLTSAAALDTPFTAGRR